ncbi:MAG TPA: hypothetical protein VEV63_13130 [Streptosporangiaceae bacterium]|nr:hypothetical protein [Streptosporangiaceae bacterium]
MADKPMTGHAFFVAAGLMLTLASCGHLTPLGPAPPQPHHLRSPIVLQATRIQLPTPADKCPAGSVALSGGPGQCYRKLGRPITITSAAVSVSSLQPGQSSGPAAGPVTYAFMIALPVSDAAALAKVTRTAADAHGCLAISVAGRTWSLPRVLRPFTPPQFEIIPASRNQGRWLKRMLASPS